MLFATARVAVGEPARDLVARAEVQWRELEYDKVIELANAALAAPDATARDRVEALRLKGSALVVLDKPNDAGSVFEEIFKLNPEYELPANSSPRIHAVFQPARARWQVKVEEKLKTELGSALATHQLVVKLPPAPRGGLPLEVGVELADPSAIASSVVLSYRRAGTSYYTTTTLPARAGRLALVIPGDVTASDQGYTLELYVASKHRSGVILRHEGTAEQPLRLAVAAGQVPKGKPITSRWWFWAGIGAIAVGGAFLIDQARDVGPQRIEGRP